MNKFLPAALLALSLSAISHREANAWCKLNFGIGANIGYQSGGNKSLLWGLWSSSDNGATGGGCMAPAYAGGPVSPTPPVAGYGAPDMGGNTEMGPMPGTSKESAAPYAHGTAVARPVSYFTANTANGYYQIPSAVQAPSYWYGK